MQKHPVSSRISQDIVNLLVERQMTLTQIAQMLGVGKSYVSRVKAGTRNFTLDHLAILENELGESLPVLLIKSLPRKAGPPNLRKLYDMTLRLLETTGSAAQRSHPKRRPRTKAA
jgi:transcriptional regulator with XRE-family HTH domain